MKKLIILLLSLLILGACSNEETKQQDETPELLEVRISTPSGIRMNEEVKITANVEQGSEKVPDADEVKFEIWKNGQNDHEMLEAKNNQDGTYSVKKTFTAGGTYSIVAHTTARRMHSMPKKEIIIEGTEEVTEETSESLEQSDENHQSEDSEHTHVDHESQDSEHSHDESQSEGTEHEHGDHYNSKLAFDFQVNNPVKSKQKTELTVHLNQNDKPLTGATVRFEIWPETQNKHEFINAVEDTNGQYSAIYAFPSSGAYNVKIHVEKGSIHDHTIKNVNVN
jgi:hypothetical protein